MSLRVDNLSFSYCTRSVLTGVSFHADAGKLLAILGPNGVGKTTLFRCILGLLPGYTGGILLDDVDARKLSPRELAHRIAYIPQQHGQAFNYSVLDMVLMGTSHMLSPFSAPRERELAAARAALSRVGVLSLSEKNYAHLSGGEQQLVLIARALAQQTKTLLMDEPTSSLDYGNQTRILEQVHALSREGYTVLLSTHNPQHALWYADMALALQGGRVAAFGEPARVLTPELVCTLYDVDARFIRTPDGSVIVPFAKEKQNAETGGPLPFHTSKGGM